MDPLVKVLRFSVPPCFPLPSDLAINVVHKDETANFWMGRDEAVR